MLCIFCNFFNIIKDKLLTDLSQLNGVMIRLSLVSLINNIYYANIRSIC